uniref:Transmembrane protein n=1 Tax=Medicago truncatula TaxID=3880 RepID=I3S0W7_MEDTR|nr:unknown [Medicago truncatula]
MLRFNMDNASCVSSLFVVPISLRLWMHAVINHLLYFLLSFRKACGLKEGTLL